ncbi:MAG: hypothetical protein C0596_07640 [Marinilabiliales bacterium]|nr:MAG: hypothetical protein C0596_07640 [Marinilabiliales bacterium]
MKKCLAILIFCIGFINAYSQDFYGGLNLGMTISQVDGDNYGGYHKVSPLTGVFVRNTFSDKWGMFAGIEYKRKGSKEVQKNEAGYVVFYYAMNMDYIEVPVLATYSIEKIGIPGLFSYTLPNDLLFDFGVSYSYLINGTEDFGSGPLPPPTRPFRKYEIANHIGLNYPITENWYVCWRLSYTFLFLPVREHPGGQVYWFNRGQYNHNMSFSLKYEF